MNSKSLTLALGLVALAAAPVLSACGTPEDDSDAAAAEEAQAAPVGKTTAALTSCFDPVRRHATWLAGDSPDAPTNYVSAQVQAPGINRVMWIDRDRATFTPGFCLPGGACLPATWSYTISGTFAGDSISVDSAGYMTINGVRVTPSSCTVPSGPSSSRIVGTDAAGRVYTVTLYNQYLG
jgi:hypothetical protein